MCSVTLKSEPAAHSTWPCHAEGTLGNVGSGHQSCAKLVTRKNSIGSHHQHGSRLRGERTEGEEPFSLEADLGCALCAGAGHPQGPSGVGCSSPPPPLGLCGGGLVSSTWVQTIARPAQTSQKTHRG